MLSSMEVAALELALELEESIRKGLQVPHPVVLALSRLRTAQQSQPTVTKELESFYRIAIDNRPVLSDNVVYLGRRKMRLTDDEGPQGA